MSLRNRLRTSISKHDTDGEFIQDRTRDVVIVGGGSAGSVLANRLSEDPDTSVMVLEAGRSDSLWDLFIHMPAAFSFPIGNKYYDWAYESEPEPHMNGRRIYHARGKVLGGSSSINGMIFQRGNPMDYEKWGALPGMQNWDFKHVLPYFNKMETALGADANDPRRGHTGPLKLTRGPATTPLFQVFFRSVQEAGYNLTNDVNGYRQEGFAPFDRNILKGKRLSAARAYLHPVMDRTNLEVRTRALTTRILFNEAGTQATGVEYEWKGKKRRVLAKKVILCGGAFNTPQLLQVSGVGDREVLEKAGVDVVKHLPGVGANLQDHLEVYVQYNVTKPVSVQPNYKMTRRPFIGLQWLLTKKGPVASSHFEAGGFARSNDDEAYPNLMFHFLPMAIRYDGTQPEGDHGFQFHVGPMYSDTLGHVHITSPDPKAKPEIIFNYLATEQDRREWVEAVRVSRRLLDTDAMKEYTDGEISPGADVQTDEEILEWVRNDAETALHPSCTAKMGSADDAMAVVDPENMQVHGIDGLYVCDASAMPIITNGNIYAPVIMMAEKAADLIKGIKPLAPIDVPFYKAKQGMPLYAEDEKVRDHTKAIPGADH
ncbi:choline dehydrogenase [Corynebacterium diphtheriae]|uniref:choline dehydrogenase n=1 Tax=Corynebacterium diphtheriae TaxID=1717 RepID=UPI0018CAB154|nr:choline dehydrogenase [Corynebacterium diphtheriae]MBG9344989.1 choline dehydrogenase [Corynebacterium diphtheriae bv. gravis]MBG9351952.1 choline dehydrogenase [Corynebacterium diphtheriae bv. gravis]